LPVAIPFVLLPAKEAEHAAVNHYLQTNYSQISIPLNDWHLRRILREWSCHYNRGRPHRSLGPDIPDLVQAIPLDYKRTDRSCPASQVIGKPILSGLHHEYRWAKAA
jgi:hypothetical protein